MFLAIAMVGGLLVGIGIGLLIARPREVALRSRIVEIDRALRERILPVVERHARRLDLPVQSVPPLTLDKDGGIQRSAESAIDALGTLCELITERETTNSLALSDTVQLAKKEVGDLKKLRSG